MKELIRRQIEQLMEQVAPLVPRYSVSHDLDEVERTGADLSTALRETRAIVFPS